MGNASVPATGTIYIDSTGTLKAATVTLMVDAIVWWGTTAAHALSLTDANDETFVDITCEADNPIVIPFPKPRKLAGLKCATIGSGICTVYLHQA